MRRIILVVAGVAVAVLIILSVVFLLRSGGSSARSAGSASEENFFKDARAAQKVIDDALALEDAGAFSVLLEAVPDLIAKKVTERLKVPTIGVGAGVYCDGQGLVVHDLLGLFGRFTPKVSKRHVNLGEQMLKAFGSYIEEVKASKFPTDQHSFHIDEKELGKLE